MKNKIFIVSHTHWDREWYMSFESHRARLVELFDTLIETMEKTPDYKYFHMDGQTIVIEDYLEIKPFMKPRLDALIKAGRIQVGPWYVLQDEALISGEANVRNMLEGFRFCKENGYPITKIGYMPDAFANISQMPQILSGFNIDTAVFGRGVGAILYNNTVGEAENSKELVWEGADNSKVMGIMFTNWYNNAAEMPTDEEHCKEKMDKMISAFKTYAKSSNWLGMNGSDHQPIQKDLPEALELARRLYGDEVEIVHSNFNEFVSALRPEIESFGYVKGELVGQKTAGQSPLSDTASTHQPLKNKNHMVQNLFEQQSEPISVMSYLCGDTYRSDFLRYGYKKLMQNHPHDSICACSCDDVAIQMSARFDCARDVGEFVRNDAAEYIASNIDTASLGEKNIVVFHTNPFKTKGVVTAEVWLKEPQDFYITDCEGNVVNTDIKYHGSQFTFKLPKDKFRVAIFDHKYTVKFPVALSGVGYTVFKVNFGKAESIKTDLKVSSKGAENKYIKFSIEDDGTITLFDKISGKEYKRLNQIEDGIDWGNGYNYKGIENETRLYTTAAEITLKEKTEFYATYQIKSVLNIPKGLDGEKSRSEETIEHVINTFVTITADSRRLDFALNINNQSENHRLRALFTTNIDTPYVYADGQFDVIKRQIKPLESWKNPCYNQRFQAFVSVEDEACGFMVASRGLNSYEVLRDGKNTIALTLLRSVGTIGDWTWGKMSNPLMQVKGDITLQYSVIPFSTSQKAEAYSEGYAFNSDCLFAYETDKHKGKLPTTKVFAELDGNYIRCTAIKKAENSDEIIMRLCNVSEESNELSMRFNDISLKCQTNLLEEDDLPFEDSKIDAKKIVTLKLK